MVPLPSMRAFQGTHIRRTVSLQGCHKTDHQHSIANSKIVPYARKGYGHTCVPVVRADSVTALDDDADVALAPRNDACSGCRLQQDP